MKNYNSIPFYNVKINGGFWEERQRVSRDTTLEAVYDRFFETKRFEALKCNLEQQKAEGWQPHIFWDSDAAKWIESASYALEGHRDAEIETKVDGLVDDMCASQLENGYYNCYYNIYDTDKRFKTRYEHELYCLGHLIEAAVAYYHATGKDKLLGLVERYTELVYRVFVEEGSAAFVTPGHEEIELSLIKLYHTTKNKKYLELAKFFIDKRGNNELDAAGYYDWATANYAQDHLPVREQTTAEGHSVRAMYLYIAMADVAREYGDEELLNACRKLFDNITNRRMYITGGIGSSPLGEAFTVDYDMPNEAAYTETCATLSLALFCRRLTTIEPVGKYADAAELALYNGSISGVSIDGDKFFYENPLTVDLTNHDKNPATKSGERYPITQRVKVFGCSCCPPNILRVILSAGDFLYTYDDDTLYVHHYIASETEYEGVKITQKTNYPCDGKVIINVNGSYKRVAVRVPGWCDNFSCSEKYEICDGYAYIDACGEITLDFNIKPRIVAANPKCHENAGRAAIAFGPVVYCMERVDNNFDIFTASLYRDSEFDIEYSDYFHLPVIGARGCVAIPSEQLYTPLASVKYEDRDLYFIPYYGFENRGETDMQVWIPLK